MISSGSTPSAAPLLFDRSARLRMQFTGAKAAESLTGLVTNDVLALKAGEGLYACALTAKGRIIADVRILANTGAEGLVDSFVVDANTAAGVGFAAMIRKYVNPRLAKYADISATTSCLTLHGTAALDVLRTLGADASAIDAVGSGLPFTHRAIDIADSVVTLVRVPDLGATETFDLLGDVAHSAAVHAALVSVGATPGTDSEWHRLRVIAGRPEWGIDMDEGTLAQEANMDALQAISYKKGCYTGQETVARVHFRGHVNRTLRRISSADTAIPPLGAPLAVADGNTVGDTRSIALDDEGQLTGIAMLRREVADGAVLIWSSADDERHTVSVIGAPDE